MGRFDKDTYQKELAVRYCLARRILPFLEVVVRSTTELSDSVEVLTDLDVLGIETVGDVGLRRTIFDCKTANKMSSVNRAFWAAGVKQYTGCDEAYVILRNKAVHNHRISVLSLGVDLHDERSFTDLARTADQAFPSDNCYQASIERWRLVYSDYVKNPWSETLFDLARNAVPLTTTPWATFRRILAELRSVRGQIDPKKTAHTAIYLDVIASSFVLWAVLGRDIRRFYEPTMEKAAFEKILRYYLWGGKDSYAIRQQMKEKGTTGNNTNLELPEWDKLVSFAGIVVSAPQSILECAHVCRELSVKAASGSIDQHDKALSERLRSNSRVRQFSVALSDYLVAACGLPSDIGKDVQTQLFQAA